MLQTIAEDASPCCVRAWQRAADKDALDAAKPWECPKCGCEYAAQQVGPLRIWQYNVKASVIR